MIKFVRRMTFIKQITAFALALLLSFATQAQKKELTNDQYFKNNFKGITTPLPRVLKWIDDSHFILIRDGKNYEIDAKTGAEKEYVETNINKGSVATTPNIITKGNDLYLSKNVEDIRLTNDVDKEINPTVSPDGNYVAYTKNNDLYTVNLSTIKETRITKDGTETILNGYASWVYMEEILGRSGNYRAFWWSPDSKHIAFFRSDDSKIPVFTITDGTGLHGLVETQRYPKVGDPNPEVKLV